MPSGPRTQVAAVAAHPDTVMAEHAHRAQFAAHEPARIHPRAPARWIRLSPT